MNMRRLIYHLFAASAAAVLSLAAESSAAEQTPAAPSFIAAKPVWQKGAEKKRNLFLGFRATFAPPVDLPLESISLKIPLGDGTFLDAGWRKEAGRTVKKLVLPAGWTMQ